MALMIKCLHGSVWFKGCIISVISFGFSSANKLTLLLLSVFASSSAAFLGLLTCYKSGFHPELVLLLVLCHWHLVISFPGVFLQLYLSFENAMVRTGLLLLGRSGLAGRGNPHTWCWWNLVNKLGKEGDDCIKILLIIVWVCPYCGDLQMPSTFLSVKNLNLSGLSSACSLMSNLAASGLNPTQMYVSWSHDAIISGPCFWCTLWILNNIARHHLLVECPIMRYLHICIFCIRVFLLSAWASGSILGSDPS